MKWNEVTADKHKIEGSIWVECIAEIRHNDSGEVREYDTHEILDNDAEYPNTFNWAENNFSCDCNRRLFFKRAKDEETEDDWDRDCTDDQYSVNLKNKVDNVVYYKEFEHE